jgi:hypothetical protein
MLGVPPFLRTVEHLSIPEYTLEHERIKWWSLTLGFHQYTDGDFIIEDWCTRSMMIVPRVCEIHPIFSEHSSSNDLAFAESRQIVPGPTFFILHFSYFLWHDWWKTILETDHLDHESRRHMESATGMATHMFQRIWKVDLVLWQARVNDQGY